MSTVVEKKFLTGWYKDENGLPSALNHMFGEMIKHCVMDGDELRIKQFHGDLRSDALWIDKHVKGDFEFFYGVDESGTAIGTDRDYVTMSRRNVWKIHFIDDVSRFGDHSYYVTIEVIA